MSPAAWLCAALVACLCSTGLGWRLGLDHAKASQADIDKARQETREDAQQGAANAIAKSAAENTKIVTRVQTVTREVPVYRSAECVHDDRVFNDLNLQLRGASADDGGVSEGSGSAP